MTPNKPPDVWASLPEAPGHLAEFYRETPEAVYWRICESKHGKPVTELQGPVKDFVDALDTARSWRPEE